MNVDDLEARRLSMERFRQGYKIFVIVFALGALAAGAFLGMGHEFYAEDGTAWSGSLVGAGIALFPAVIVPLIVWSFTGARKKRALEAAFKSGIVAAELQNALEDVNYDPKGSYSKDYVMKLNFFRSFDSAGGSDHVRAKYRGRRFTRCDETLFIVEEYEETDSDGDTVTRTRKVPVFGGSITALELSSACPARLLICADSGIKHAITIPKKGEPQMDMAIFGSGGGRALDSLKFKREYRVSGSSNEAASAMLTPRRVECLRKLDESVQKPFALLFEGEELHLIVSGENFFEAALGKNSPSITDQRNRVAAEIKNLKERLDLLLEMDEG
ncbi:MAG: DUF3137 domain-containing protein [Synergistaceae bacterium]|nr:DUF3137 domain-containing protein [Synergistaceae bacterium]